MLACKGFTSEQSSFPEGTYEPNHHTSLRRRGYLKRLETYSFVISLLNCGFKRKFCEFSGFLRRHPTTATQ